MVGIFILPENTNVTVDREQNTIVIKDSSQASAQALVPVQAPVPVPVQPPVQAPAPVQPPASAPVSDPDQSRFPKCPEGYVDYYLGGDGYLYIPMELDMLNIQSKDNLDSDLCKTVGVLNKEILSSNEGFNGGNALHLLLDYQAPGSNTNAETYQSRLVNYVAKLYELASQQQSGNDQGSIDLKEGCKALLLKKNGNDMTALEKMVSRDIFKDKFPKILKMLGNIWKFAMKSKDKEQIRQVMLSIQAINDSIIRELDEKNITFLVRSLESICEDFCKLKTALRSSLEGEFLNSFDNIFAQDNKVREGVLNFCRKIAEKQSFRTRSGDNSPFFTKLLSKNSV